MVWNAVGVEFDLKVFGDRLSFVCNTDDRVRELCEQFERMRP